MVHLYYTNLHHVREYCSVSGSPLKNAINTADTQLSSENGQSQAMGLIKEENFSQNSAHKKEASSHSLVNLNENSIMGPASLVMYPSCDGDVCKNYARCSIENSEVKCHCPLGFTGQLCDKGIKRKNTKNQLHYIYHISRNFAMQIHLISK